MSREHDTSKVIGPNGVIAETTCWKLAPALVRAVLAMRLQDAKETK